MLGFGLTVFELIIFASFGVFAGFIFCIFMLVERAFKGNIAITFVCDLLGVLCAGGVFLAAIFKFENGLFAIFEVVSFLLGFVFVMIFMQNLFVKPIILVYNKLKLRKKKAELHDKGETRKNG